MSDLHIVVYKDHRFPKSIRVNTQFLFKTLFLLSIGALLLISAISLSVKFYLSKGLVKSEPFPSATKNDSSTIGPLSLSQEESKYLKDQVEQLQAQVQNAKIAAQFPKEIDKKNPVLALFTPNVSDISANQEQVQISNFRFSKTNGKSPATLTFELHNAKPGESTEKGYIVVLARSDQKLQVYPNAFNLSGPHLLDFEKGETFQVARFRLVNAQFSEDAKEFQVLIFTRKGELLINSRHEVK